MADWQDEATRAIGMALAPRTKNKYTSTWVEFSEFRRLGHLEQAWPAPVEHIQQFIVELHWRGLTPGTIRGKLAALSFYAKANGIGDASSDFRIRKMLEGWSRERGRRKDERTPISPAILSRICDCWGALCRDKYEESLFRAAALLAFFGAMRISELVALGRNDVSRRALQLEDVAVWDGQVRVRLRSSKTDQYGKGNMVILGQCTLENICPVRAMKEFGIRRGTDRGYFFQHKNGSPLTKYQFWALTDMALESLGIKNMRFGTHSFRIGAASTAAALGYDVEKIKRLGRWSSTCFRKYIRQLPNV
uniref:Integrase/recombinase xerD homolog n=1 Tax=Pogona vitticeps TaxID=103695 RepID=A0ABM5EUS7_9SAUR